MISDKERLLNGCVPEPNSGCWLWEKYTSGRKQCRYGFLSFKGKKTGAHRVSYILFNGEIPVGMEVCHKCDTPECINPNHLFVGTHSDNLKDMHKKGRRKITSHRCGHSWTPENTLYVNAKRGSYRRCKACAKISWTKYNNKKCKDRVV